LFVIKLLKATIQEENMDRSQTNPLPTTGRNRNLDLDKLGSCDFGCNLPALYYCKKKCNPKVTYYCQECLEREDGHDHGTTGRDRECQKLFE
jgi:hypothetical protein